MKFYKDIPLDLNLCMTWLEDMNNSVATANKENYNTSLDELIKHLTTMQEKFTNE